METKQIDKEFNKLISKKEWGRMPSDYKERFKTYKCRFLNISGNNKEKISIWKKVEMLVEAGKAEIKINN
jgi:hypothetical protein